MTSLTQLSRLLTQFDKLDLGFTYDDSYGCMPSSLGDSKTPKVQYPNLYVNRVKDDVMGVPETGTALVEYKITGRNMSNRDGKTKYGMDVEIRSFDPQAGAKAKAKESKPGAAKAVMLERLDGALTELAGGYMNTQDGVQKERGVGAHLKRNAATYATIPLSGIPILGLGIDRLLRKDNNIRKTSYEPKVDKKGRGRWKVQTDGTVVKFSALTELARGDQVRKVLDKTGAVASGFVDIAKTRNGYSKNAASVEMIKKLRKAVAGGVREIRGAAKKDYKFCEFSDRSRDGDGQFVGAATGGADPVTMRQAYGKKALVAGAGAAALAGAGMLGGTRGGRKLVSQGLKAAGGGLHKLRGAVVSKNSGGRGQGFMKSPSEKPGAGAYMQRRRMQGE